MSRRFLVLVLAVLVAAVALPVVLTEAMVRDAGGTGILSGTVWVANGIAGPMKTTPATRSG